MKRSFDDTIGKADTATVATADYISTDSSSPEHLADTITIDEDVLTDPVALGRSVLNKENDALIQDRSINQSPKLFQPSNTDSKFALFRPRMQTFKPASFSYQIPSVRMGPPYPGIRNPLPCSIPPLTTNRPFPHFPMAYRNRLFSPGTDLPSTLITTINLDDSCSSSIVSDGGAASSEALSEDEIDILSVHSDNHQHTAPAISLDNVLNIKTEHRAQMSSGQSRVVAPIITIYDSDESPPGSPKPLVKKAKLTAATTKVVKQPELQPDASALIELLPMSDTEEDMTELLQYGMSMINPETLLQKLAAAPVNEKPKRVTLRGLCSQVKHGGIGKVISFLRAGSNPSAPLKSDEGKTALHMAASKGHLDILLILLYKAGSAKVDCYDNNNRTPLFMAVERKHLDIAQFLVKAGANFRIKNSDEMNLLHVAARKGAIHIIKWLVKLGLSLNDQDSFGWTALMWAAETDTNSDIIKYLMKKGALTNLVDNEMNICLHWSAIAGSFECTKELITGSADSHVNARNKFGETPLHVAAKGDHFHVTQYLLLHGADHKIKNKTNATALDVCPAGSKTFHCIRIRNEVGDAKKLPYKYIMDISRGKERIPVSCINEVDNEPFPSDFVYVTKPEESSHVIVRRGLSTVRPCKCIGTCSTDCKCIRLSEKQRLWYSEDGRLDVTVFEEDSPVLYECTPLCSCWRYCPNRLVQKGIQYPLQVCKTRNKGWGLRTLAFIPLGAFVLSYVGELITDEEAEKRNEDTYLFNLDLKTSGDEPNCMDALRYGNCGRFINHSCDANMRAVKLFTNHRDVSFPEVAFFAYRDIEVKEELCFNYGDSFWDVKLGIGMYCKCASEICLYSRTS